MTAFYWAHILPNGATGPTLPENLRRSGPGPRGSAFTPGGESGRVWLRAMATNVMIFCHPLPYWLILRTDATFMFAAAIARDQALVVLVYFPWSIGFIARWLLEGLIYGEAYPSPTQ